MPTQHLRGTTCLTTNGIQECSIQILAEVANVELIELMVLLTKNGTGTLPTCVSRRVFQQWDGTRESSV